VTSWMERLDDGDGEWRSMSRQCNACDCDRIVSRIAHRAFTSNLKRAMPRGPIYADVDSEPVEPPCQNSLQRISESAHQRTFNMLRRAQTSCV
jgi:hypothetical protein